MRTRLSLLLLVLMVGACATAKETHLAGRDGGRRDGAPADITRKDGLVALDKWVAPDKPRKDAAPHDAWVSLDLPKPPPDTGQPDLPPPPPCPDVYESNNNCSAAGDLGSVTEGTAWISKSATLNPAGDVDWFKARGLEKSDPCIPFTGETFYFRARVTLPAGRQAKVCLYLDSCSGTSTCVTAGAGQWELKLKISGTCTLNDDTDAYILVQALDMVHDCTPYSVGFNFDNK